MSEIFLLSSETSIIIDAKKDGLNLEDKASLTCLSLQHNMANKTERLLWRRFRADGSSGRGSDAGGRTGTPDWSVQCRHHGAGRLSLWCFQEAVYKVWAECSLFIRFGQNVRYL